ncbi:hypothetical protein KKD52_17750 [Myxococcota bacterium]|nr:hypothetical protein [Myxococcota bacterium]MBU1412396.1 hypothetical protein [Myxococcota bacterium]MBU1512197.1 hypothetical protein [Myxococcota bacterium]
MKTLNSAFFLMLLLSATSARGNSIEASACDDVFPKTSFLVSEPVCTYGDIDYTCRQGMINLPGGYLYVVPHGAEPFTGSYIDLYTVGLGYAGDFYQLQVMAPPLAPGEYDLVIDEHCDGLFTADDVRHDCAFQVVGAPPTLSCDETQGGSHSPVDPGLASGALCRGTCGEDCHENACSAAAENTTCSYDSSSNYHLECTFSTMSCGSHQGCRAHDDCYDACAASGASWTCWRQCDMACISSYGVIACGGWAFGHGPYDQNIQYASVTGESLSQGNCEGTGCTW